MRAIKRLVIHHSASSTQTTVAQIREWHVARGWSDIGYHRVIEGDGSILDGRPVQTIGAHAKGSNRDSIGICVVGDNTREDRKWTKPQERSLSIVIRYYQELYPGITVLGHRDAPGARTECPGLDIRHWCQSRGIQA